MPLRIKNEKSASYNRTLLISTSCAYASSGGCGADSTSGATNYSSVVDDVTVNQTDNVTGREFTSATLSSTNWQYACTCSAGKAVKLVYMVSPVLTTTGHQAGYYKLNDSLDIKTTLQANDIPGLVTDQTVSVNTRFTQIKATPYILLQPKRVFARVTRLVMDPLILVQIPPLPCMSPSHFSAR